MKECSACSSLCWCSSCSTFSFLWRKSADIHSCAFEMELRFDANDPPNFDAACLDQHSNTVCMTPVGPLILPLN